MVLPDKTIGIVQTANEKGVLRVQMPDKNMDQPQKNTAARSCRPVVSGRLIFPSYLTVLKHGRQDMIWKENTYKRH